jgi:AcrR family transcriptional regulator
VTDEPAIRVEHACQHLLTTGAAITFDAIAAHAGIGRATLYRRPELRAIIEQHRQEGREALTLTGLQVQIDQLRLALEAVAAKARRHEEELRHLKRTH